MADEFLLFNWSNLYRHTIVNYIWQLYPLIVSKELPQREIHQIIAKHLKKEYPLRITQNFDKKIESGVIYVGGLYCSDLDNEGKKCIVAQLFYKDKNQFIILDTRRFRRLCVCIADTLLHEIIHMRQFRRRNFKYLPDYPSTAEKSSQREEQSYLGSSDEIDAYGFNIACELVEKFKNNQKKIVKYLDDNQKNKKRKNNSWRMYLKAFDHDHNHRIIKRLKKKVIRYLPNAELGKPYKNKDWIIG